MESFSRLCFVLAVALGLASGETAVALGIAAAPAALAAWSCRRAFARRARARARSTSATRRPPP